MSMDIKSVSLMVGNNPSLTDRNRQNNSGQNFAKSLDGVSNSNTDDKKSVNGLQTTQNKLDKAKSLNQTDESNKADSAKKGKGNSATDKELKDLVGDLNESIELQNLSIEFKIDKEINQTIVKVVDKSTGDIVRQLPSKEMVEHLKHLKDLSNQDKANKLVGIILDKQA